MIFDSHSYSMLIVSSSDKFNDSLKPFIRDGNFYPVRYASSVSSAKRKLLESNYDFVIIKSPLTDDFGSKMAIDISSDKTSVCLLFVKSEMYEEITSSVSDYGVYTLYKPTSSSSIVQGLNWMKATRERLRLLEKKSVSLEDKMDEIRIVNKAKWVLIDKLKMTEGDAHKYIEKNAMDTGRTKRSVAEDIIDTYT